MASTSIRAVPAKPRRTSEEIAYTAAVIAGLYASTGRAILHAKNHDYTVALKNVCRVARDQAAEMMARGAK